MSFHQRYEFLAIDRPLQPDELAAARKISSHATVTPTRFAASYDWGDLRGDPDDMLRRWYDLHLYRSSNGARLVVKLPAGVLDSTAVDVFDVGELQSFETNGESLLVSWRLEDDDSGGWINDDEVTAEVDGFIAVRAALLRGDLRPLYVGWLAGIEGLEDEDIEPPVPPGLGAADDPSADLARFLGVDDHLLAAAAETSARLDVKQERKQLLAWLSTVPVEEKDAALASFLGHGDSKAQGELQQRLASWGRTRSAAKKAQPPRTVAELTDRAQVLALQCAKADAERKAAARAAHLDAVAAAAAKLWTDMARLAEDRSQSGQQLAITRLRDLRDAADKHGKRPEFDMKLAAFVGGLRPTRVLYQRIKQAGMLP